MTSSKLNEMRQIIILTPDLHIVQIESHAQSFWLMKYMPKICDIVMIEECMFQNTTLYDEVDKSSKVLL